MRHLSNAISIHLYLRKHLFLVSYVNHIKIRKVRKALGDSIVKGINWTYWTAQLAYDAGEGFSLIESRSSMTSYANGSKAFSCLL